MVDNKNSGETHSISPTGSAWCISSRRTETGDLPISSRNDKQHSATKPTKKKKSLQMPHTQLCCINRVYETVNRAVEIHICTNSPIQ